MVGSREAVGVNKAQMETRRIRLTVNGVGTGSASRVVRVS